jgi:DNA (cytosine-5)-methyltransferase 1
MADGSRPNEITYGSVCSGIEAASVAWEPLGWKAAWFAEIEPFPSAVLAHHYPVVPNLGDMTTIARRVLSGEVVAPDILVGGTPCQAFSVAGARQSLDDARGNLTLRFMELANAIDFVRLRAGKPPVRIVWENVPGVLSTKDNALGCFLGGLAGEDVELVPPGKRWSNVGCVYGPARAIAWRTLDAQYFGLAQRRRRVFVVASARDGFDPAQVLLEWEGLRRDSAPRRTAGQSAAAALAASAGHHGYSSPRGDGSDNLVAGTLQASGKAAGSATQQDAESGLLVPEISLCLNAGAMGRIDSESETMIPVPFDTTQITSAANRSQPRPGDACHPLAAHAHAPAVAFDCKAPGLAGFGVGDVSSTMRAMGPSGSHQNGGDHLAASVPGGVRRLTPTECERLQGFPDGYTNIPYRNGFAADGPRYKALGNSMATNVMAWIGQRLNAHIERGARQQEAA